MRVYILLVCTIVLNTQLQAKQPNVIIVLTDDQGYGDMSCHGNPILKTPHIDRLSRDGVRFNQFFVGPLCQPSRASLMTGRNKVIGRRIEQDEQTLPQLFKRGGYTTAIFGKWHLGDYQPFRPIDKGFDEQLLIGAGAIGQVQDYWGNSLFDTWLRNSDDEWEQSKGFCTDVLFDKAMEWMNKQKEMKKPFFTYVSTNAPHEPWGAPEEYIIPYRGKVSQRLAVFYGMIANIDYNVGRLRDWLEQSGLAKDTLLIFMNDNGTAAKGYNAGLKGRKASITEGGSRAASFWVWPQTLKPGLETQDLALHHDILPTMADICSIPLDNRSGLKQLDGISLKPALFGKTLPDIKRHYVVYQGFWPPDQPLRQYNNTSIRSQDYRLANGNELYHLRTDRGEEKNVISQYPEKAAHMRAAYDEWWKKMSAELPNLRVYNPYPVGTNTGQSITMCSLHYYDSREEPDALMWYQSSFWKQSGLEKLLKDEMSPTPKMKPLMGCWKIDFKVPGIYAFSLGKNPGTAPESLTAIRSGKAWVALGSKRSSTVISTSGQSVTLTVPIEKSGVQLVECWFEGQRADDKPSGAYFVDITRIR